MTFCQSRLVFLRVCNEWIMDHDLGHDGGLGRGFSCIVYIFCWASGVGACRAWHFGTFAAWSLHTKVSIPFDSRPQPQVHHHMGKVTPLNDFLLPSVLHTHVSLNSANILYPFPFVWDLFVPMCLAIPSCLISVCKSLKFKNKIQRKKLGKVPTPRSKGKLRSRQCFWPY